MMIFIIMIEILQGSVATETVMLQCICALVIVELQLSCCSSWRYLLYYFFSVYSFVAAAIASDGK